MKAEELFQLKKVQFLRNQQAFKKLTRNKIMTFIDYLIKEKYTRGETVYKEGEKAEFIYIVKKGEFELERMLPHHDGLIRKGYEKIDED